MSVPEKVPSDLWEAFSEFLRTKKTHPEYAERCRENGMTSLSSILMGYIRSRYEPVLGTKPEDICGDILVEILEMIDAFSNEQEFRDKFKDTADLIAHAEEKLRQHTKAVPLDLWLAFSEYVRTKETCPEYAKKCCENGMTSLSSILMGYIRSRFGPVAGAAPEDICHDYLVEILEMIDALSNEQEFRDKFENAGKLVAFAKVKVRYHIIDLAIGAQMLHEVFLDEHRVAGHMPGGDDQQEAIELPDQITADAAWKWMRESLPYPQGEALVLHYGYGMSHKEIVKEFTKMQPPIKLTENAAKQLVYRAKKKLIKNIVETIWKYMTVNLTDREVEALELCVFDKMSYKNIAEKMDITVDDVKRLVYNARKKLLDKWRYFVELTYEEVAKEMGITVDAAKWLVSYAKKKLIDEYGLGDEEKLGDGEEE